MKAGGSLYLELLKNVLSGRHRIGSVEYFPFEKYSLRVPAKPLVLLDKLLRKRNFAVCKMIPVDAEQRLHGYDWPADAETMTGKNRLDHLEQCVLELLEKNVEGDLLETGVWRGGTVIFLRAILKAYGITGRTVWAADSFRGVPAPEHAADRASRLHTEKILAVSLEEVKANFRKYELLDGQVQFLEGRFRDTLPAAPVKKLALLRLDGDLYESTMDALVHLYPKLSPGGYLIVDDYNAFDFCKKAVDEYRQREGITEAIVGIDKEAVYWKKE